jgi:hypothetical protein
MTQLSPHSLQLWVALKDVEEYIRDGIVRQMNGTESFGGDDMLPLKAAHLLCDKLKPVLSASVYQGGRHVIQVAVNGLNGMLDAMRKASLSPANLRQAQMTSVCDLSRAQTLAQYQVALTALEPIISKESMQSPSTINNITISGNSGIINLQSVLSDVTQSISHAGSLDPTTRQQLTALFSEFTKHLEAAQPEQPEAAEAAAAQAKELAVELALPKPRAAFLRIKGIGLIEAAKALATVVPIALTTAKQIVEFVSPAA